MEEIYLKILDTFDRQRNLFGSRGLPAPRTIDVYQGQPDNADIFEFLLPAIFIDWQTAWRRESDQYTGTITIDAHVLMNPEGGADSFNFKSGAGVQYIRFVDVVKQCLNELATPASTRLALTLERPVATEYYKYHVLSYTGIVAADNLSVHKPVMKDVEITGAQIASHLKTGDPATFTPEIDVF